MRAGKRSITAIIMRAFKMITWTEGAGTLKRAAKMMKKMTR